jgi:DNA repair protein RadC
MLTIEDCIGLSDLTEEEILAISQHEHIPEMAAVELGNYLVQTTSGEKRIKAMIVDDIDEARRAGNVHRAAALKLCLKHFLEHHAGRSPNAAPEQLS